MEHNEDYRQANCQGYDPEMFFPVGRLAERGYDVDCAREVCRACPISETCLQDHIDQEFGFFGGTTPKERHKIRERLATRPTVKA